MIPELTNVTVPRMDMSNYDRLETISDYPTECVAYYTLNEKRFELHKYTDGPLTGTICVSPKFDNNLLCQMYDESYFYPVNEFGSESSMQVGIADRNDEEVQRRHIVSGWQCNELEETGFSFADKIVVEIGGGSGYLSEEAAKRGATAINVELCAERANECTVRGTNTADILGSFRGFHGQLGDAIDKGEIPAGSLDAVMCYDLLEHIVDPHKGFIQDINTSLKEGGILAIRIPETPKDGLPSLHLVDHVNHFTYESAVFFLEQFGFEEIKRDRYSGTYNEETALQAAGKKFNAQRAPRTIENQTLFFRKVNPVQRAAQVEPQPVVIDNNNNNENNNTGYSIG